MKKREDEVRERMRLVKESEKKREKDFFLFFLADRVVYKGRQSSCKITNRNFSHSVSHTNKQLKLQAWPMVSLSSSSWSWWPSQ